MRPLLVLFFVFASLASARAGEVEFVRVWPEWRNADSFKRISEYFTGRENTGRELVRRSQPDSRDGFYFLVRLRNDGPGQPAAKLVLSLIKPDAPQTRVYTFPVPIEAGEHVLHLGLTGKDWAGPKVHPVAWKLEAVATDGTLLASSKSFLWEKPAH